MNYILSTFATDSARQLDVLRHNGHTLGVDGAQVCVFEQTHQVGLTRFLFIKKTSLITTKIHRFIDRYVFVLYQGIRTNMTKLHQSCVFSSWDNVKTQKNHDIFYGRIEGPHHTFVANSTDWLTNSAGWP